VGNVREMIKIALGQGGGRKLSGGIFGRRITKKRIFIEMRDQF
jgi:hypothetical protein